MICKKCNRVKLRAEEEITVMVDLSTGHGDIWGHAIEDSKREHNCRLKVGDIIDAKDIGSVL